MKIGETMGKKDLITEGVKILWHDGYYDGPLSGVVEYQGKKHYFIHRHEYFNSPLHRNVYRSYWICYLTDEQWKRISYWHEEFCLHVSTDTEYHYDEEKEQYTRSRERTEYNEHYAQEMFFERYEKDIIDNGPIEKGLEKQIVGWCVSDVLYGRPFKDHRRSSNNKKKKKQPAGKKNVPRQKKNT